MTCRSNKNHKEEFVYLILYVIGHLNDGSQTYGGSCHKLHFGLIGN